MVVIRSKGKIQRDKWRCLYYSLPIMLVGYLLSVSSMASSIYAPTDKGVIIIKNGFERSDSLAFSQDTVLAYDGPNGKTIGIVYHDSRVRNYYHLSFSFDSTFGQPLEMDRDDVVSTSDESLSLRIFDTSKGFIRILRHAFGTKKECWVKKSDLIENKIEPMLWVEYFMTLNPYIPYFKLTAGSLIVRQYPDSGSSVAFDFRREDLRIMLTGQRKDDWLGVKVSDKYLEQGIDTSTVNWTEGWIKAIDDTGVPEIWYFVKGC